MKTVTMMYVGKEQSKGGGFVKLEPGREYLTEVRKKADGGRVVTVIEGVAKIMLRYISEERFHDDWHTA